MGVRGNLRTMTLPDVLQWIGLNRKTGLLNSLTRDGVFFVPAGEVNYYHALAYEARGQLGKAIIYYQKFVNSGAHPKFQKRARENLQRLRKQLLNQFKTPPTITPVLPSKTLKPVLP